MPTLHGVTALLGAWFVHLALMSPSLIRLFACSPLHAPPCGIDCWCHPSLALIFLVLLHVHVILVHVVVIALLRLSHQLRDHSPVYDEVPSWFYGTMHPTPFVWSIVGTCACTYMCVNAHNHMNMFMYMYTVQIVRTCIGAFLFQNDTNSQLPPGIRTRHTRQPVFKHQCQAQTAGTCTCTCIYDTLYF